MFARCLALLFIPILPFVPLMAPFGPAHATSAIVAGVVATVLAALALVDDRARVALAVVGGWVALSPFILRSTLTEEHLHAHGRALQCAPAVDHRRCRAAKAPTGVARRPPCSTGGLIAATMSSDTCKLVHDLSRPEAYGRGATAIVKLLTTHASWVFLVGDDVWKVKRPVDFGFLDFRSVEARRRACEEELRLNQRLAPDVYIGVEPIRESPTGYAIGGEGPIADWTVHMQRLPDEASARALLARGALDARALEQIADTLAEFFRNARPTPQFGVRSALLANVEENFAQVQPFTGHLVDRETLEQVRAFQKDQLSRRPSARPCLHVARIRRSSARGDHRLHRVQRTVSLRRRGGRRRVPGDGAGGGEAPRPGGRLSGALRRGQRRLWPLHRPRFLPVLPCLGSRQGRRLSGP
jgi:hypothetical protein